jgi:hypothetical protein
MNNTKLAVSKITSADAAQRWAVNPWAVTPLAASVAAICALLAVLPPSANAQFSQPLPPMNWSSAGALAPITVQPVGNIDYSTNRAVKDIVVEVERSAAPADGVGSNTVTVKLFDANNQLLTGDASITIETSAGRILLPGARTDELGPGKLDADKTTPGIQLKVTQGQASFRLLSPQTPGDVKLRITAGQAVAEGSISYLPELREMLAVGLIEGIIRLRQQPTSSIVPARVDDGFERELRRWVREFNGGKNSVATRVAFFLKGQVKGDVLLTMAVDSEKDTKDRLYKDVDPNRYYPVYGDASVTGFEARSRDRLFVRLDSGKSYALYGDFLTGDGFSQNTEGGSVASAVKSRNLGQYNRTATGLRGHYEQPNYFINGFFTHDALKQLIEEYKANGTSGPFSVGSLAAIEGSEKIELITRDRNALDRVLNVLPQVRLVDYSFEPFSGRVLFKAPISSVDINGNPQSIRITYEVEQGGQRFNTVGVDGQLKLGSVFEVGGSIVHDKNPLSPYRLNSFNLTGKLSSRSSVVFEVAQSNSTRYLNGYGATASPEGSPGEIRSNQSGRAYRVEGNFATDSLDTRAWWLNADKRFYNQAASVSEGRTEIGASGRYKLNDHFSFYLTAQQTTDGQTAGDPKRRSAALGLTWLTSERLTLDASVRNTREDKDFSANSLLAANSLPGGGFFGSSSASTSSFNGNPIIPLGSGNAIASGLPNNTFANATTIRLSAMYKVTDVWSLNGEIEGGSGSTSRFGIGSAYQINERSRAYIRYEKTTGLTSQASILNRGDRSNALVAGIDNTFTQGPTVYSEYRLRDSQSASLAAARDQQLATGVRNTWNLREGLAVTGNAEHLKILSGNTRNAFAVGGGVDYSASEYWKTSGRLEYRRLFDDKSTAINDTQNQYLSTLAVARKLSRDWTFLGRNYLFVQNNLATGKRTEDRFQVGAAWRPVDHNRWNMLNRYEYKTVKDTTATSTLAALPDNYNAHVVSLHSDYHPSRPWWFSNRFAAKSTTDKTLPAGQQSYRAYLAGGRAVYDITENWDIGLMAAQMWSPIGGAKQRAFGAEAGYLVQQNLWLSAGFNFAGFKDRDLVGSDYTNKGFYIRLRFKFDENLFKRGDKDINRTLDR